MNFSYAFKWTGGLLVACCLAFLLWEQSLVQPSTSCPSPPVCTDCDALLQVQRQQLQQEHQQLQQEQLRLLQEQQLLLQQQSTTGALPDLSELTYEERFARMWQSSYRHCSFAPNKSTPLTAKRKDANTYMPELCVMALSCRRYGRLQLTLNAIVSHIELYEPTITYEMAFWDMYQHPNCTQYALDEIIYKYQINKWGSSPQNHGFSFGINVLSFGMCRAPYILNVEEDYFWESGGYGNDQLIRKAIQVLEDDPSLLGVYFCSRERYASTKTNSTIRATNSSHPFQVHYLKYLGPFPDWNYVSGGSVFNKANLMRLGFHIEVRHNGDGELDYKNAAKAANLTMAWVAEANGDLLMPISHIGDGHVSRVEGRPGGVALGWDGVDVQPKRV
eukprot:TRINITY_DN18350_c0_g1_i1.p1 TRINITY_DN18350_c0_g1~~TRINITY_DN18350_c0_g1_i1.p1  ORF type:complete len:389 (-),score=108.55 TRINITY_DN18350_c0_g1_i1:376-1542(-)